MQAVQTNTPALQQEIVRFLDSLPPPPAIWQPQARGETTDVLAGLKRAGLSDAERTSTVNEAAAILSRCVDPARKATTSTGLAVGQVQSGKTTSFITLAALACDSGYPLVIVMGGISKPLFAQSEERFEEALRIKDRGPVGQKWVRVSNPATKDTEAVRRELAKWHNPEVPANERKTLLLLVMKNHARIRNLNALLARVQDILPRTPTLVIDDEADQAGLNSKVNEEDTSTTYERIMGLRAALPWHSYVMYTATPQAPLLISIIDSLSPDFPAVLPSGDKYTGGEAFFGAAARDLVRVLKDDDNERDADAGPPESLLQALRVFFVGVAAGYILKEQNIGPDNRTMMVHPSQRVDSHQTYATWVRMAKSQWASILRNKGSEECVELERGFHEAYRDLERTCNDGLPPFQDILAQLPRRIEDTNVQEMNARGGATQAPDWTSTYSHILVGGQAMDRGFTVKGLTVTYMPRGAGEGNADTLQQRARFFGYKKDYIGFCRVYLPPDVKALFVSYVKHEQHMHLELKRIQRSGMSLKKWKRAFLMDPDMRPTRAEVLRTKDPLLRENFSASWWNNKAVIDRVEAISANREVFKRFIAKQNWSLAPHQPKATDHQKHLVAAGLQLEPVIAELLADLEMPRAVESLRFTALLLQLRALLDEHPDVLVDVYLMGGGKKRVRSMQGDPPIIENIFQGEDPGTKYPGDANIRTRDRISIQLRWLDLRRRPDQDVEWTDVPVVAIRLPEGLGADMLLQYQKEQE